MMNNAAICKKQISKEMTLYTGLREVTTAIAEPTATTAKKRKNNCSITITLKTSLF